MFRKSYKVRRGEEEGRGEEGGDKGRRGMRSKDKKEWWKSYLDASPKLSFTKLIDIDVRASL